MDESDRTGIQGKLEGIFLNQPLDDTLLTDIRVMTHVLAEPLGYRVKSISVIREVVHIELYDPSPPEYVVVDFSVEVPDE